MRHALHDVLHHTIWDVLGVREQVVEQERRFYADVMISVEGFDPFKPASGVNQRGSLCISVSHDPT